MSNDPQATSLMEPEIEELLGHVDGSKFQLVALAAKRGRQVNSYFNQLSEGLGTIVPPQVSSTSRKPLSIALEEVAAGKIVGVELTPEELEALQAAEADAAAELAAEAAAESAAAEVVAVEAETVVTAASFEDALAADKDTDTE